MTARRTLNLQGMVLIAIVLGASSLVIVISNQEQVAYAPEVVSSPAACSTKSFVNQGSEDSSGALTFTCAKAVRGVYTHFLPADAAGLSSIVQCQHAGFGSTVTYTPKYSGNITIEFAGQFVQNTGGDGMTLCSMRYGTGTAPANGVVSTGTVFCPSSGNLFVLDVVPAAQANTHLPDGFSCSLSGLTIGTTYWFDITIIAIGGGTVTQQNPYFSVFEASG